jgi:hypothetical protein
MGDKYDHLNVVPENLDEVKVSEPDRLVRDKITREAITPKEAERRLKAYVRSLGTQMSFPDVCKECRQRWNLKDDEIVEAVLEVNHSMRLNRATKYAPIAAAETFGTPAPAGNYQAKLAWAQGVLTANATTTTNDNRQLLVDWLTTNYSVLTTADVLSIVVSNLGAWYVAPPPVEPEPPPVEPEVPGGG